MTHQPDTAVVFFSRGGNTKLGAEILSERLNAKLIELKELRRGNALMALFRMKSRLDSDPWKEITGVRRVYLMSPVWAGSTVPAMNAFAEGADFTDKDVNIITFQNAPDENLIYREQQHLAGIITRNHGSVRQCYALLGAKKGQFAGRERILSEIGKVRPPEDLTAASAAGPVQQEAPVTEETPVAEETLAAKMAPIVAEAPAIEEIQAAMESLANEETWAAEKISVTEEVPATEVAPDTQEIPVSEGTPVTEVAPVAVEVPVEEVPVIEVAPVSDEIPAAEKVPATVEVAAGEEVPAAEKAPATVEVPVGEEAPAAAEAPQMEEIPVGEEAPAAAVEFLAGEEAPVTEAAIGEKTSEEITETA